MAVFSLSSPLLNREQAAEYLGIKKQTLAAWASMGRYDLPLIKVGRSARYRLSDLDDFIERRRITHSGQLV